MRENVRTLGSNIIIKQKNVNFTLNVKFIINILQTIMWQRNNISFAF